MYINYSTSSGKKTVAGQITNQPGSFMGVDVRCPDTGRTFLTVYDSENSDISGKLVLAELEADAGMVSINHEFFAPVAVNRGIYVDVSGTGVNYAYIVRFAL